MKNMALNRKKAIIMSFAVFAVVLLIANPLRDLLSDVPFKVTESSKDVVPDKTGEYNEHGDPLDPNDLSGTRYAPKLKGAIVDGNWYAYVYAYHNISYETFKYSKNWIHYYCYKTYGR